MPPPGHSRRLPAGWQPGVTVVVTAHNDSRFLGEALISLIDDKPGTHGEVSGGATFTGRSFEAFVRGEIGFGSDYKGRAVRAGVRLRF